MVPSDKTRGLLMAHQGKRRPPACPLLDTSEAFEWTGGPPPPVDS